MIRTYCKIMLSFLLILTIPMACTKESVETTATLLTGTVKNETQDKNLYPAFIFHDNKLIATTNFNGAFQTDSLIEGTYNIKCSAVGYADLESHIEIKEGRITSTNFSLLADNSIGKIFGEFHDKLLYKQQLITKPEIQDWTAEMLFDGVSGATMQRKTLQHEVPEIRVLLGDSIVATADGYGQYGFNIQCGTYPISVTCNGYKNSEQTIEVTTNDLTCINFILENN